jgi:hypothetical protein
MTNYQVYNLYKEKKGIKCKLIGNSTFYIENPICEEIKMSRMVTLLNRGESILKGNPK